MKFPLVIASVALTAFCWGIYGPVLHSGQLLMGGSRLRAFLCVGLAYFVIAVIVPLIMLSTTGEKGEWSLPGFIWSSAAGAAGALGALGIILAFNYGGKPVYVMPLVFGCAPVINSFWTIYWAKTWSEINPFFAAGLLLVAIGAVTVLFFAPTPHKPAHASPPAATDKSAADAPAAEKKSESDK